MACGTMWAGGRFIVIISSFSMGMVKGSNNSYLGLLLSSHLRLAC